MPLGAAIGAAMLDQAAVAEPFVAYALKSDVAEVPEAYAPAAEPVPVSEGAAVEVAAMAYGPYGPPPDESEPFELVEYVAAVAEVVSALRGTIERAWW